jgi:hypothetical protein
MMKVRKKRESKENNSQRQMLEQLNPSKTQRTQILCLIFLAVAIVVVKYVGEHNSATEAMTAIAANCNYEQPGAFMKGNYVKSAKWCRSSDEREMTALINHLKIYCENDVCVAPEFGSNVAVLYSPYLKMAMINPKIVPAESTKHVEVIDCEIETNEEVVQFRVESPLLVEFINDFFQDSRVYVSYKGACLMSHMLKSLYN